MKSIRNLPENYKSDQDPNKNFYTISNSAFPEIQRNPYVENLKRYDFSINTPMKLKENKFEENILNNIFHQVQEGQNHKIGIPPYTISWALVSFPKKDEVFVEQIQSDLPTIVCSINKDKEKKQKLEEEYGKENVSDFIRKYANYALVYPYQVIEKIAEFAITNNIKRIKLSSVKDILDVAEVSNTKKAKKVYEDIPKELGFKIEDNYSIYDGDMEELKQRVQKAMVEEKQEKSIQLSKRQKLLNIDKVQEILNNVLKERSNLIQVSNNLSDLMKQIGQLFSIGKISKTEFKMLSGLLPKQVEASLDHIIKKIANYYIDDFKLSKRAKDPLSSYKKKRKFDETSEPEGDVEKKNKHRFVIQEHDASNLHWDLRLENDEGTMSSWAIPKHHLPNGKEKLLAISTEPHPIDYMKFQGTIEKGYGAGEVEIHDSGIYEEIEESKDKIVFKLKGKKEKGTYKIFKTDGNKWMIMEQ
jgi:DNA ligase D-like protein (predicted 3'-phosphoesterase)